MLAASTHFECFITTPHSWGFLICFFYCISWSPVGNLGHFNGSGTAAARAALPIPTSECSIFVRPDKDMASSLQCALKHWCMQLHMGAVLNDTITESALEDDSGRKFPCCTGYSNLHQYHTWLFSHMLYSLSYPGPVRLITRSGHMVASLTLTVVCFCWAVKKHWETDPSQSAVYI